MEFAPPGRVSGKVPMVLRRSPHPLIRELLAGLPGVRPRRLFGSEAFFAGPVMFAFAQADGLVLRLPDATREAALASGRARPFLGPLPEGLSGWVVVPAEAEAEPLVREAWSAARGLARSAARRRRPARVRVKM